MITKAQYKFLKDFLKWEKRNKTSGYSNKCCVTLDTLEYLFDKHNTLLNWYEFESICEKDVSRETKLFLCLETAGLKDFINYPKQDCFVSTYKAKQAIEEYKYRIASKSIRLITFAANLVQCIIGFFL